MENGYSKAGVSDNMIDLKTKTFTPGWIDMHVHVEIMLQIFGKVVFVMKDGVVYNSKENYLPS